MIRIKKKYQAREILSFRALYLFIYLYISIYFFKGGRSIRIFQSWGGGGKSVDTNKNAIGVV